ncbi:sugar phosphate nucleotidyltransferase [Streptomyces sp. NPDC001568]|uniref:sugar phosphate nucleotidyltransferase n=1 Tax=Streptomyces sp. NPDC001568 TaxID=3364588 RepID=UPI003691C999
MKALVLSGGSGTRPRPRSSATTSPAAGPATPAAGRPVLVDILEGIAETGILDVGIVLGEGADEVRAAVGDGTRFGVSVTYLPRRRSPDPAQSLRCARDWLGEDDFVTYPGDTFVPGGIGEQLERFRTDRPAAQAVPGHPGVYFFTDAVHRAVEETAPADDDEAGEPGMSGAGGAGFTDVLRRLADQGLEVVTGASPAGATPTPAAADTIPTAAADTIPTAATVTAPPTAKATVTVTDTAVDHGRPQTRS